MEQLVIHGGHPLRGHVKIGGAKNAVLPIIAAALLGTNGKSVLDEVRALGVTADYTASEHRLVIDATHIATVAAPYDLVRKMRASFLIMGPLLAREGHAEISLPGGCAIGTRPIVRGSFPAYSDSSGRAGRRRGIGRCTCATFSD